MITRVLIAGAIGILCFSVFADDEFDGSVLTADDVSHFVADNRRKDRRDDRQGDRDDKQDCRQEEGRVGDDKRECKQEERGEGGDDGAEADEEDGAEEDGAESDA